MPRQPDIGNLGWAAEQNPRTDSAFSRDLVSAYNALRTFESDFDKAQGQLRAIASAWLLAGIGATGFLILQEINQTTKGLTSDAGAILREVLLLVITLGISSIWKLDQKVYQNLLHNVFALGYWVEFKYPQVPPTRMNLFHSNYDITDSLGEFYSRPILIIWFCGVLNLVKEIYGLGAIVPLHVDLQAFKLRPDREFALWGACAIVFALHTFYLALLLLRARGWGRLGGLLPDEAADARTGRKPAPARQPFPTRTPAGMSTTPAATGAPGLGDAADPDSATAQEAP